MMSCTGAYFVLPVAEAGRLLLKVIKKWPHQPFRHTYAKKRAVVLFDTDNMHPRHALLHSPLSFSVLTA